MAKKSVLKIKAKNAVKELVEKTLESLLLTIEPGISKKEDQ